ncbi:MAG: alkaline shock response membrane anchor protein AmaP [Candidatus Auribacterota bacterium]|jgi:hypothetical protein|nr:alkaline shock response membrane anchor protein AmaP [Candidatus Auribacterota bacterium]
MMKNFIRFIFHSIFALTFLALGLLLLDLYFERFLSISFVKEEIELFFYNRLNVLLASIVFVGIPILYFFINISGRRKETFLHYNTGEGEIMISIFAVEDFIRKVGKNFREIKDVYPSITLKGKDSVNVNLKIKIWAGVNNLPLAIEEIQKEVRIQLQNMLGIENVNGVNVFLAKDSFAQRDIPTRRHKTLNPPDVRVVTQPIQETQESNTEADYNRDEREF